MFRICQDTFRCNSFCSQAVTEKLTHWGRVTHICVVKLTIIGSDNGLSPGRRQAIIWTNAGILLIGPLGTNNEISIRIQTFLFKKMHFKMSSAKWRPFCLDLNVLIRLAHNGIPMSMLHRPGRRQAWTAPSHYLNQCWNIVNWTLRNKLHWNFNRNSNIFIQENAIENGVCEMASILSRPQWVKEARITLTLEFPFFTNGIKRTI